MDISLGKQISINVQLHTKTFFDDCLSTFFFFWTCDSEDSNLFIMFGGLNPVV